MGAQLLPIGSNKSMATQTIQIETPDVWVRLADSPQWEALTEPQKVFVLEFLTTGSVLQATKAAYNTSSEQNARVLSYELSKNPTIRAALDVAAGRVLPEMVTPAKIEPARKKLIALVRKQLKAAELGSVAASKFTTQLERLKLGIKAGPHIHSDDEPENNSPTEPQTFPIGAVIVQDGKKYQVKAEEI